MPHCQQVITYLIEGFFLPFVILLLSFEMFSVILEFHAITFYVIIKQKHSSGFLRS